MVYTRSLVDESSFPLADVEAKVKSYVNSVPNFSMVKITEDCYALKTLPSNRSCLDFLHVTRKGNPSKFSCSNGSKCDRVKVKVSKKTTSVSLCPHEHLVALVNTLTNPSVDGSGEIEPENDKKSDWLSNTSKYRFDTQRISLDESNMRSIEKQIIECYKNDDFPTVYQVLMISIRDKI